jgi:hypothetical protein
MRTSAAFREREEFMPVSVVVPVACTAPAQEPDEDWRHPADMPVSVYRTAFFRWLAFLGVFWITFSISGSAEFMVTISTVYAIVFFGVPTIMTRLIPKKKQKDLGLFSFLNGHFDTFYGEIEGWEALIQVIIVPAALTLGGIAMGFIIHAARIAH